MSTKPNNTKPEPTPLIEQVQAVADATRIDRVGVEVRQNGTRHVITMTDEAGTRILAYCDPLTRGKGFRLHVQDYGSERRLTVKTVAQAAKEVRSSARLTPRPKAAPKPKKEAKPKATAKPKANPKPKATTSPRRSSRQKMAQAITAIVPTPAPTAEAEAAS
jgi:hypothetical protein